MSVFKLVGVLLDYFCEELWEYGEELFVVCDDLVLNVICCQQLCSFVQQLLVIDVLDVQVVWLVSFDRGCLMSLLLFEYIYGELCDRGQVMVDLVEIYCCNGFELDVCELLDYLLLLLEFLVYCFGSEVCEWLYYIGYIVGMLVVCVVECVLLYWVLFEILVEVGDGKVDLQVLCQCVSEEVCDDIVEVMDCLWEEEVVCFGVEVFVEDCKLFVCLLVCFLY